MRKLGLALLVAGITASPVSAGVTWNWGSPVCGGNGFETCISTNVVLVGNQIVVTIGNMGPGTITGVGLWNLPAGVSPISASASITGWNTGGSKDINGVVGVNSAKYAVGTKNGINNGLIPSNGIAPGNVATFAFTFASNANATSAFSVIGVGVHSQGYIGCSTKLFVTPNGAVNPYTGGADNCLSVSVPEPGSMALLATGLAGMVFIGRRRRANLVDENGDDIAA